MRRPLYLLAALLTICTCGVLQAATVNIAAPPNGATINGSQVEIAVNFSTSDVTVTSVEVYLDGAMVTQRAFNPASTSGTCAFKWDTTRTANGKHTIGIVATHASDIVGSAKCEVTVSNTGPDLIAPKISITSPKDGDVVSGTTPILVQVSDNKSSDPFVSIYVDDSLRSVSNQQPYVYNWDTTAHENGPALIDVTAMDDSDNKASAKQIRVIVRNSVKQVPIAANSVEIASSVSSVPSLPSPAELTPNTTAAPKSSSVGEAARTESGVDGIEKFEVKQSQSAKTTATASATPKSTTVAELPATKPATTVQKAAPAATASTATPVAKAETTVPVAAAPKTEAYVPSGVSASASAEPVLMAKALGSETLKPTAKAESLLSAPAAPKPAAKPVEKTAAVPDGDIAKTADKPLLVVSLPKPAQNAPVAKTDSRLAAPAAPKAAAPKAEKVATASKPAQSPVLVSKLPGLDSAAPTAKNDIRLAAPAKAASKPAVKVATKPVRIRPILEKAGASIEWNHTEKTVHAVTSDKDIKLKIGSAKAEVNKEVVKMDKAPFIIDGRTIVSPTFVNEVLAK